MFIPLQGSGQAARAQAQAAQAQVQAARAQADAAQQQLQQQIEQTVQQAIQQAEKSAAGAGGNGMSDDAKQQLKEEIRAAIDAAREASTGSQGRAPRIEFGDGNGGGGAFISVPNGTDGLIPREVPEMVGIVGFTLVCCVVGLPLARAFARWLDRRGTKPSAPSQEVVQRLSAIEQAVESVAVEVERISEGQRFTSRLLSERTHEPAGNFAAPERDRVPLDVAGNAPANVRRG